MPVLGLFAKADNRRSGIYSGNNLNRKGKIVMPRFEVPVIILVFVILLVIVLASVAAFASNELFRGEFYLHWITWFSVMALANLYVLRGGYGSGESNY